MISLYPGENAVPPLTWRGGNFAHHWATSCPCMLCTAARPLIAQFGVNESHISTMSIQFVAGKLKGEERKAIIQAVQKHMQEAVLGAIRPLLTEFCEEELTVKLGGGNGSLGGWADKPARLIGSVESVAVGMRITSREMGIIAAR